MKKRILILLFVLIATRLYALINIGSVSDFKGCLYLFEGKLSL